MGSAFNPDGKSFAHAFDVDLVSVSHSMGLGNQRGVNGKTSEATVPVPRSSSDVLERPSETKRGVLDTGLLPKSESRSLQCI
jgi:hypothetical protein